MSVSPATTQDFRTQDLTRGATLARNSVWNLTGLVAPILAAAVAIPPVIRGLGTDRFGVLTVAWVVVGYFSLFDLGLGRALTNIVAYKLGRNELDDLPETIWTASLLMFVLGLIGGGVLAGASGYLTRSVLKIPADLQSEVGAAFLVLSVSVPFVISSAGFRGVLEAQQHFGWVNAVRVPLGIFTFVAPLGVLPFTKNLAIVFMVLVSGRVVVCFVYLGMCLAGVPTLAKRIALRRQVVRPLLNFGAWMTVSNIVSPIMAYMDRFLVGAMLSMTAVAYYATPYELTTKVLVLPGALVSVMFPAFSTALSTKSPRANTLFERTVTYTLIAVFPITLFIVVFARLGLNLWLGKEFADHASRALQILTIGVLLNGLALIPFAYVQGAGRADLTGKLHLIELPCYLVAVFWLTRHYGIEGTALAWTLRVGIDCAALFWLSARSIGRNNVPYRALAALIALEVAATLGLANAGFLPRMALFVISATGFGIYAWRSLTGPEERNMILLAFRRVGLLRGVSQ